MDKFGGVEVRWGGHGGVLVVVFEKNKVGTGKKSVLVGIIEVTSIDDEFGMR